jgi:beta-lactamase regulating signal transducer with metallopeptidase domain
MMSLAQFAVERVLNSLPEGLLIAFCAWLLLRLMGRQNSGTRFAVWLVALAGVVVVPFLRGFGDGRNFPAVVPQGHSEVAIPAVWAMGFFILWIVIAVIALARVVAGVWQVRHIRRSCTEIPEADLDPVLREVMRESSRPVRLLTSEETRIPAALGFRNPAIVLPAWTLRELSPAELKPILIHELAHLRRHDDWTNLLQKAIRAILIFHPAVWWIDARLSMEREMACDDAVLAATGNPRAYAGCLIDLLEKGCARRGWSMAQAAVARARDASVRIARILHVGTAATTRVGRATLSLAAALSLACAGVALYSPRLVEFVPMEPTSAAQITKPLLLLKDGGVRMPAAAMIPASFHPTQNAALRRSPLAKRNVPTGATRHMAVAKVHTPKPQVMMASFTTPDGADQGTPEPMFVVFETRESSGATSTNVAQFRTPGARTIVASAKMANAKQVQSQEDPALQIQMFEAIDPVTGSPVQILHIVLVVPQRSGSMSQSI